MSLTCLGQFEFYFLLLLIRIKIIHLARLLKRTVQMLQETLLVLTVRRQGVCGFSSLGKQSFKCSLCQKFKLLSNSSHNNKHPPSINMYMLKKIITVHVHVTSILTC